MHMLQVDGGEVVIVTAENFWNEITKVQARSRHVTTLCQCLKTQLQDTPCGAWQCCSLTVHA